MTGESLRALALIFTKPLIMAGKYSKKRVLGFVGQDAVGSAIAAAADFGDIFKEGEVAQDVFEINVTIADTIEGDFDLPAPKAASELDTYSVEVGRIFKIKCTDDTGVDFDINYKDASGDSQTVLLDTTGQEVTFLACEEGYVILAKNF